LLEVIISNSTGRSFITAIINSECEAEVANLLFSHGNNIIYRALTFSALTNYLNEHKADEQLTIIYSTDLVKKEEISKVSKLFVSVRFIPVTPNKFDATELIACISESIRKPMVRDRDRIDNLIAVIGSPSSPGVSTIANQVAARFNGAQLISLKSDAYRTPVSPVNKLMEVENLNFFEKLSNDQTLVMDAGSTVALTSTLTDRRISGQLQDLVLNAAKRIVYVIRADTSGINYLSKFIADYQNLILPPAITYLLNQQRFDSSARLVNTQFLSIVSGKDHLQLPFDYRAAARYPVGDRSKLFTYSTFSKQLDLLCKSLV
jgi:cytidylate kinase